jgi:hypothetical protein
MTMHLDPRFVQLLGLPTCACGGTGTVQVTNFTADGLLHTSEPCDCVDNVVALRKVTPAVMARPRKTVCRTCGGTRRYLWTKVGAAGGEIVDRYGDCPDCAGGAA